MAGRHRIRKLLYERRFVVAPDWSTEYPGWWRITFPSGHAAHEKI